MKFLISSAILSLPTFGDALFDQGVVGFGQFCIHRGFGDEVPDERGNVLHFSCGGFELCFPVEFLRASQVDKPDVWIFLMRHGGAVGLDLVYRLVCL